MRAEFCACGYWHGSDRLSLLHHGAKSNKMRANSRLWEVTAAAALGTDCGVSGNNPVLTRVRDDTTQNYWARSEKTCSSW